MLRSVKLTETVGLRTYLEYKCQNLDLEVCAVPKLKLPGFVLVCSAFKEVLLRIEPVSKGVFWPFISGPLLRVSTKASLQLIPGRSMPQRLNSRFGLF